MFLNVIVGCVGLPLVVSSSAWMPTSNSDEEGGRLTTDYRYSKTKQTLMRLGIISYIDYCHSFKLSDNRN